MGRALTYDSISFYRKVSSEARFDFLNFYIDNMRVGQWSGEMDWERVVFPVMPGYRTFRWEYSKDPEISIGKDAAFIDLIEFLSNHYTTADAGKDATIYECQVFAVNGIATYYDSLRWSTTGTGAFSHPTEQHSRYTPSHADIEAGWVSLILTVYGSTVNDIAIDSMNLTILPQPTAFAGNDQGVCKGQEFNITSSSATNYTNLFWSTLGDGDFDDPFKLMPVYYPGSADTAAGNVTLLFVSYAGNDDACGVAMDTLLLTLFPLPVIPLPEEYRRCTGYTARLDATTAGGTAYEGLPGGQTVSAITVDSAGTGAGMKTYTVTVTGDHGCVSTTTTNVIFEECVNKTEVGNLFFRAYPIPASEYLTLELFSPVIQKVTCTLSDSKGGIIWALDELTLDGQQVLTIPLRRISAGNYIMTVQGSEGKGSLPVVVY